MKCNIHDYSTFKWTDIENPSEEMIKEVRSLFEIDENYLVDALEHGHLPKIERTNEYVFMILRAYSGSDEEKAIEVGEISNKIAFFIHKEELITLHRAPFAFFEKPPGNIKSIDGIVLYLINEILLTYDWPIQQLSEKMDKMEQIIFLKGGNNLSVEKLYFEKSKARLTKKILLITQDVINQFQVQDELRSTLHDTKDTLIDFILKTEEIVDDANALLNSYMSFTAQKSNEVMKLLTIFSAFFLPLTFIAGVYGMNFKNMPELEWEYGYFLTLLLMLVISISIYLWFKKKKILK